MSQEQLAQVMTMSGFTMHQTTVAKLESGKRPLRIAEFYAIADILDVPLLALLANRVGDDIRNDAPSPIHEIEEELSELMYKRADIMERLTVWLKVRTAVEEAASFSVHDLRHVAATLAIGAGADVKLVQQMLGDKDATETLNTYAALWDDRIDEVAKRVEKRRARALKKAAKQQPEDEA